MVKRMRVVTLLTQQPKNVFPSHFISIDPAIPKIQLLKFLTLKIQGQVYDQVPTHGYI